MRILFCLLVASLAFGQAPTNIPDTQQLSTSRGVINTNFTNLYNGYLNLQATKGGLIDCSGTPGSVVVTVGITSVCSTPFSAATGSGLVGFSQAGGAAETVQTELRRTVTPNQFGAATTALSAINAAALASAFALSNNVVMGGCGTYPIGSNVVTVPHGVSFDGWPECVEFTTTGDGGFIFADPYRQRIRLRTRRISIEWPTTDTTSLGVKIIATTGAYESKFDLTISNYYMCGLLVTSGSDITDNLFEHVETQDCKIAWDQRPVGGNGTNQNTFLKFSSRINGGSTCPTFSISAATNASPIQVTATGIGTAVAALTGKGITIAGATGNTAANGKWVAAYVGPNTITLTGSTGSGAYTGSGMATVPIAGTKYLYLEAGSDNSNTWIAPELQGECVERSADLRDNANIFLNARLEGAVPNSFYMAAGTAYNQIYSPYLDSGIYIPTIQDLGQNYFSGIFGTILDTQGANFKPLDLRSNGANLFNVDRLGNTTTARKTISGTGSDSPVFNQTGAAPTLGDAGFGTGATIVRGIGASGRVLTGSAATATSGNVAFGTIFNTSSECWAQDVNTGVYLPTNSNSSGVQISSTGGNLPFAHYISFGCIGW